MTRRAVAQRSPDRGASMSVFLVVVVMALFLIAGLVIDGGAQVTCERRAEVVAAQAARAGVDASAAARLSGGTGTADAVLAARRVLASQGVTGTVSLNAGVLHVTTSVSTETTFLSLLGKFTVTGSGDASAVLVRPAG